MDEHVDDKLDGSSRPSFELELESTEVGALDEDIPEIGHLSALTDAVLLLFDNIESRLTRYLKSHDSVERSDLHLEMKQFLTRISANPLIPIHFRLKVLRTFSKEVDVLDAPMTSAILGAYKISILLLLDVTKGDERFLLALAKVSGEAITLAKRVTQLKLIVYDEPGNEITSQVFALLRLGMSALSELGDSKLALIHRANIEHGAIWFELVRMADFFSLTPEGQEIIYKSLEPYIGNVQISYCPRNQRMPALPDSLYLVTHVSNPEQRPRLTNRLEPIASVDRIILNMTQLVPKIKNQYKEICEHMECTQKQRQDLRIEREVATTHAVTLHLIRSLSIVPRNAAREGADKKQWLSLVANLNAAFQMPNKSSFRIMPVGMDEEREDEEVSNWHAVNTSNNGMSIETDESMYMPKVGSLVRIVWNKEDAKQALWGRICWRRHFSKSTHSQIGLNFLPRNLSLVAARPLDDSIDVDRGITSYLLAARLKAQGEILAWSGYMFLQIGSKLVIEVAMGKHKLCIVRQIRHRGENFLICQIEILEDFIAPNIALDCD
ncbi:MAG: hypothetical protein R8M38_03450 [Mariprofundaceae bacterium]